MKRYGAFLTVVGLVLAAHGVVVTAADGDTVVIGTEVTNAASTELVVTTGASGVTLVLPPADAQGTATVWTRIYLQGTGTVSFAAAASRSRRRKGRRRPTSSSPPVSRPTTPRRSTWPRRT